jgi:NAD(P)-dependent dehydrogenase (short-subunit alcohol dehydrogenase family)
MSGVDSLKGFNMKATGDSSIQRAVERFATLQDASTKGTKAERAEAFKELQTYELVIKGLGIDTDGFKAASRSDQANLLRSNDSSAAAFETLLKASAPADLGWSTEEIHAAKVKDNLQKLFGLEREVALVTGGGAGIGRDLALGLASAGAKVAVMGRTLGDLQAVVDEITSQGGKAVAVVADVTNATQVDAGLKQIQKELGNISVLVNNAGIADHTSLEEASEEQVRRILDVNVVGPTMMTQAVAEQMKAIGGGSIINIESTTTTQGSGGAPLYALSKGAVGSLTTSAAKALAEHNIHVNAIVPGFIFSGSTDPSRASMSDWMGPGTPAYTQITERTPLGRVGTPEDLVGMAVYFAAWRDGQAASFTTSAQNKVDGGIMNGKE